MALAVPLNQLPIHQKVLQAPTKSKPAELPAANPTRSFWINTPNANPLAREGSEGLLTSDVDVCIIGSGITGVSTAYHLAKTIESRGNDVSLRTLILDAREFCKFS